MHFGIVMDEHGNRRSMLLEVLEDFSRNNREPHRMSSIDRAIALAESYAVVYGFMKESDPSPLSLVAHSDVECIDDLSGWDLRIDQYMRLRIGENFKISVVDFMNLPRRLIKKLITTAEIVESAELKQRKAAEDAADRMWQQQQHQVPTMPGFQHQVPKIK